MPVVFYPNGRTIGQVPLEEWVGPGVVADISDKVSNSSVYTPEMIESVVDVHEGDILVIKTGWWKYGWISKDSLRPPSTTSSAIAAACSCGTRRLSPATNAQAQGRCGRIAVVHCGIKR